MLPMTSSRRALAAWLAAGSVVVAVAVTLIVAPAFNVTGNATPGVPSSTVDPAALVMPLAQLPARSVRLRERYISTRQASRNNGTSETILRQTGRQIGFERDYRIPRLGEFDIEVVRFRTSRGLNRAYDYFLTLPATRNLRSMPFRGAGERADMVVTPVVAFVELKRGRFYVVMTAQRVSAASLNYLSALARRQDRRIQMLGGNISA